MTTNKLEIFKEIATTISNVIHTYSLTAEKQVDEKFKLQLGYSIYFLTNIYVLLKSVADYNNQDEITDEIFESNMLIWQACNSTLASTQLIRQGYPLEPQNIMRVALESFSLAMSFHLDDISYTKYLNNKLSGEKTILLTKKTLKEIGEIYGLLSAVTHPSKKTIGNNFNPQTNSLIIGGGYTEELSNRVLSNFAIQNYLLLTIWKGAELIFYKFENNPKFWQINNNGDYTLNLDKSLKDIVKLIGKDFKILNV